MTVCATATLRMDTIAKSASTRTTADPEFRRGEIGRGAPHTLDLWGEHIIGDSLRVGSRQECEEWFDHSVTTRADELQFPAPRHNTAPRLGDKA